VTLYKPGPQARYLVERMSESEKHLLEAVYKLSKKMDTYDKRITLLGSNISKVQSQVDLSMKSFQVLQKEKVVLLSSVANLAGGVLPGHAGASGVMGSSPMQSGTPSSTSLPPQSPIPAPTHNSGDAVPVLPRVHHSGDHEADMRKTWMPKMDFPCFDGSDVRIWLDKCSAYFQLYAIPPDFRVTTASLHMVGKASHW
jgi:hypothetical protein